MSEEKAKAAKPAATPDEERRLADGFIRGFHAEGNAWKLKLERRTAELEKIAHKRAIP